MKLEDVRQRIVEEELRADRDWRMRDLLPGLLAVGMAAVVLWMVMSPPAEWARGEWFDPGGWLRELLGYDGAVFAVRAAVAMALAGAVYWFGNTIYSFTPTGRARKRAKIAAEQPRFRRPGEER